MLKDKILNRINEIKKSENDFTTETWNNAFVPYTKKIRTSSVNGSIPETVFKEFSSHISYINFSDITDEDLVRLFEYIITKNK